MTETRMVRILRLAAVALAAFVILAAPASAPAQETAAVGVRVGDHPGYSRLVFDWRRPVDYRVENGGPQATIRFTQPASFDLAALQKKPPRLIQAANARPDGNGVAVVLQIADHARVRHFRDGTKVVIDVLDPPPPKAEPTPPPKAEPKAEPKPEPKTAPQPVKVATGPAATAAPKPLLPAAAPVAAATKPPASVPAPTPVSLPSGPPASSSSAPADLIPTIRPVADGEAISLPWAPVPAAAAFERAGRVWLVFDRPAAMDTKALVAQSGGRILEADQIQNPTATVLRLRLAEGLQAGLNRDDAGWKLSLSDKPATPAAIPIRREPAAAGGRLRLVVASATNRLDLADPEVGDTLTVVPVAADARGIGTAVQYPQFMLLPTAQGIAVQPKSESVLVKVSASGVEIEAADGLLISPESAGGRALLLDVERWRREGDFASAKQTLQRTLASAPAAGRNAARFDLARFYFARGFHTDALAVLARLQADDPAAAKDRKFRALRGAARLQAGQLARAGDDLNDAALDGDPEIGLWRGWLKAEQGDAVAAKAAFATGADVLGDYPPELRGRFRLAMAKAALANSDPGVAEAALAALKGDHLERGDAALAILLRAEAAKLAGSKDDAKAGFEAASATLDRRVRPRAELARIEAALGADEIKPDEAIARLDALRYAWRGDDFEFGLLRRLGELQLGANDPRAGLGTLKQLVTRFAKAPDTPQVTRRMSETFEALFLEGGADKMPPLAALGLYYDFQELTPVGPRGDEMIRKLADRLVAVDLLGRAAELMGHQVKHRLIGEERARIAARLAVVQLLDRKPQAALDALRGSAMAGLPGALVLERKILEARALTELARYADALQLLKGETAPEAEPLRTEIHWRAEAWAAAAASIETRLGERWKGDKPFDAAERALVLQLATAASLAGDAPRLEAVRERYRSRLDGTAEADAFAVLTGRIDTRGKPFRQLPTAIAEVGRFEAFMAGYREKLAKGGLAAIN